VSGDKIIYLDHEWTDADDEGIEDGNCYIDTDLIGDELPINTFEFTIRSRIGAWLPYQMADGKLFTTADGKLFLVRESDEDLTKYTYGTPVYYFRDEALFRTFFVETVSRVKKQFYYFSTISIIGILEGITHYGGLYEGETVYEVLTDLLGGRVGFTVDPEVADIPVHGLLPVASIRANLHQLIFAEGLHMDELPTAALHFTFLNNAETAVINDDRLYDDGEIDAEPPATGAEVTEYSYVALDSDDVITLFDNTDGSGAVTDKPVIFKEPCHDLVTTGTLTYSAHGVNYAIVSGTGTLSGKAYTELTTVITKTIPGASTIKIISIRDFTLISAANSENVADRVLAYNANARTIPNGLIVGPERPGKAVQFSDPYDDFAEGFLKSLDISLSRTVLRATANFVIGYTPTGYGNFYNNFAILTGSGYWTVPPGVYKIRVILFAGGQGGFGGSNGQTSTPAVYSYGALGGEGGAPGLGGKILNITLPVTPGDQLSFLCGVGGEGGTAETAGEYGTDTTFAGLSSADGILIEGGFLNIFNGQRYGYAGTEYGVAGGQGRGSGLVGGSGGTTVTFNGATYSPGAVGNTITHPQYPYTDRYYAYGGGGGGPAVGANGSNGGDGAFVSGYLNHGAGGQGANAVERQPEANYGQGGPGGHGGGGGGGRASDNQDYQYEHAGGGGLGGLGGIGARGGPGAVLIYLP